MNNKFLFFIVLFSCYANAQMSMNEMKAILKMDLDKFETYALNRGYGFSNIKDDENTYGITYTKGNESATKFITLYEKYFDEYKCLTYQTEIKSEYLLIKKQLIESGFKLFSEKNFEGSIVKKYKNKTHTVTLINGLNRGNDTYEISIYNSK